MAAPNAQQKAELEKLWAAFGKLDAATDYILDCDARDALASTFLPRIDVPQKVCRDTESALTDLRQLDDRLSSDCHKLHEALQRLSASPTRCDGRTEEGPPPEVQRVRELVLEAREPMHENGFEILRDYLVDPPCEFSFNLIQQYERRDRTISTKLYGKMDYVLDGICGEDGGARETLQQLLKPPPPLPPEILGR